MTKAKTVKKADAAKAKKPASATKTAPAKAAKEKKTPEKPKAVKAPAKTAVEKPARKQANPGRETPAREASVQPAPAAGPKPAIGFVNSGLGVKTSSKKPALSVAPGVMILGRAAAARPEDSPNKGSERRLSKKELADIKNFLLEKRERLLAGMRRELAMQRERAESKAADEIDKATDAYDEDLSFEIATANDQELEDIQIALEKIEKGTYGECEICGCGISPSRLKILPSATTCVHCRGQEEQARRRDDGTVSFNIMGSDDAENETGEL